MISNTSMNYQNKPLGLAQIILLGTSRGSQVRNFLSALASKD